MEHADRAAARHHHPVAAGHRGLVLTTDHAGQRLQQRRGVGAQLRAESDEVAVRDGRGWYDHLLSEAAIDG